MMDSFITKDGKRLRRGYTTGSCAAAAAKAAAIMLLEKRNIDRIYLLTPNGTGLYLTVHDTVLGKNSVSCAIVKDSGDDPDVTNGIKVYVEVEKTDIQGKIIICGGEGVGIVTKPGLDQPVGSHAINSTPRRMITEELLSVCEDNGYKGGLKVTVSIPEGVKLAEKTFNPRLGIVGGISVLGTTGIVEPMSDDAVVETIRTELSVRRADKKTSVLLTPGNYGIDYIRDSLHINPDIAVTTSNFIGDALSLASEAGFTHALLVGHVGKLVKLAGGLFNTHSRWGDCRAEIFASHAGINGASNDVIQKIMSSVMTDEMISVVEYAGIYENVMKSIMNKIADNISHRQLGSMQTSVIMFSKVHQTLGRTGGAEDILEIIRKEYS